MADPNDRYSRRPNRGGLSADYTDREPESAQSGVTNSKLPRSGSRKAGIAVGILAAIVVGFLVSRMPFLAGSLNAGAPIDDMVTSSVDRVETAEPGVMTDREVRLGDEIGEDDDASSSMPTANRLTPSTVPEGEVLTGTEAVR